MKASFQWPSAELAFVAQSCAGLTPTAVPRDWQAVVDLAIHHRVFPRVLRFAAQNIPEPFMSSLRELAAANTRQAMRNVARTIEVVNLLTASGVRPLVIKGPLLSNQIYRDYAMRVSLDVDLLVTRSEFTNAARALSGAGYTRLQHDLRTEHDAGFVHPEDGTLIELHNAVAQPHYAMQLDLSNWWRAAQRQRIAGIDILIPALEHAYLIAVTHAVRHRWSRLDLIADIASFRCVALDRAAVQKCARKTGLLRIATVAEALVDLLADAPATPHPLAQRLAAHISEGHEVSRWEGVWLDVAVRERMRDRLRYLIGRGVRRPILRSLQSPL